jgi:hypothetical protein
MLCRETIVVCCENYTEYMNILCGQNAEFLLLSLAVDIVTIRR